MEIIQNSQKQVTASQSDSTLNLQDILQQCISHWWWFVVSLVVVMGVALYYLWSTPPVYTRSASIMLKEDGKGQSGMGGVGTTFSDMGLFSVNTNVNNEIFSMQSPAVMTAVVKRLHLDVDYKTDGTFYRKTLYGQSLPINIEFVDLNDNESASLTMQTDSNGKLQLRDFIRSGQNIEVAPIAATLGDTVNTPVGRVLLRPSQYFSVDSGMNAVPPVIYITRSSLYSAVGAYSSGLSVALNDEKSTIINLTFSDVCTQRAEEILNTVIAVYNENWIKDRNQVAVSTSMFINDRLGVIERELGNVEEDISSFKSQHLLPDVQAAASMYMSQSSETSAQILALNTQLSMAQYIRNYVTSNDSRNQLLPANSGIGSSNIEGQISEYNQMQLQRNGLVSNSSEQNPLVKDLDRSLSAMREAIVQSIDNLMVTLNTQISSLQQSERRTTAQLAENPSQAKYLLSVERQQKVKESLYLFLLQKREENELSQAFTAYNTRIITPPNGSMVPTYPVRGTVLLVGIVLAIAIPLLIIFLRIMMITTVRGRKDLESMVAPFMGEIPQNGKRQHRRLLASNKKDAEPVQSILVKEHGRDVINEAFRVVRTNLEFVTGTENKVVMVTSFNPGSGKTFIVANLATCFAIKGKRVVALDLDLRKASLSRYSEHGDIGVANYLAGQNVAIDDIITKCDGAEYLDIIPVGTVPPNPTELLTSARLENLIEQLKQKYDYIFIDCPPVEIVADATIISKLADMTLFVVRAGLLERSMLPELDRLYADGKYHNLSVILNGTEAAHRRYGYHKYGYSYGYHYGY